MGLHYCLGWCQLAGRTIHPAAAPLHRELAEPMDSNKGHPGARHSLPSKGEKHVFTMNSVLKNSQTWCLFGWQTMEDWHLISRRPELLWARAMLPVPELFSGKGSAFSVATPQWAALLSGSLLGEAEFCQSPPPRQPAPGSAPN